MQFALSSRFFYHFYPRDAILTRYLLSSRVRLSVCSFIAGQSCTKNAKRRITQRNRAIAQRFSFCAAKNICEIPLTSPAKGAPNAGEVGIGKHCVLRPAQTPYRRKFMSLRHGGRRPRRCAGGRIRGVINNAGCRGNPS